MNPYSNNNSNLSDQNDGKRIESTLLGKIQNTENVVREKRDEHRRKRLVAVERLRLTLEKKNALENGIRQVQENIGKAKECVGEHGQREMGELQGAVERLQQDVKFHRAQLVAKHEKVARFKVEMEEEDKVHSQTLLKADDCIRKRREMISAMRDKPLQMTPLTKEQIAEFEFLLNSKGIDKDNVAKLATLMEQKACHVDEATDKLRLSLEKITQVVAAYKQHFGLESADATDEPTNNQK